MVKHAYIQVYGFRGGAQFSMNEYRLVLERDGYDVFFGGMCDDTNIEENFIKNSSECVYIKQYKDTSLFSLISSTKEFYRVLKVKRVSLVICSSRLFFRPINCVCRSCGIPFIPIIPGGAVRSSSHAVLDIKKNQIICFSEENKRALVGSGVSEQNIHVISNRIQVHEDKDWRSFYRNRFNIAHYQIMLISRTDGYLAQDIMDFMKTIDTINEHGFSIQLTIVGSGDGDDKCRLLAESINRRNQCISFLGYIRNVNELALEYDIIVGKGRSVITPMMSNRIGIVLGSNAEMCLCNDDSFENLYTHNFSGRNITKKMSICDFEKFLLEIKKDATLIDSFQKTFEKVREFYSADFLDEKLLPVVHKVDNDNNRVVFSVRTYCYSVFLSLICYTRMLLHRIFVKLTLKKGI